MEKRKDIQIFELAHIKTDYPMDDNSLYTPMQTGAALSTVDVCELKDNEGDNISDVNWFFCEETGTYWIWKHIEGLKYIGQCQYRRRLVFPEDFDFDVIFSKYDVIVAEPYIFDITIEKHYKNCHNIKDLQLVSKIIKEHYPEYYSSWTSYVSYGNMLFYSASYIMRSEDYRKWCEFFFGVMSYYKQYHDYGNYDKFMEYVKLYTPDPDRCVYQSRIGGYLQERLFTMYIMKNFGIPRIYTKVYKFMEPLSDMSKVTFLK